MVKVRKVFGFRPGWYLTIEMKFVKISLVYPDCDGEVVRLIFEDECKNSYYMDSFNHLHLFFPNFAKSQI